MWAALGGMALSGLEKVGNFALNKGRELFKGLISDNIKNEIISSVKNTIGQIG